MSATPYIRVGRNEYRTNDQRFQLIDGYYGAAGWHLVENKGDHAELVDTGGGLKSLMECRSFIEALYELEGGFVSGVVERAMDHKQEETP